MKRKIVFPITAVVIITALSVVFFLTKQRDDKITYSGENENWICEYIIDTEKNPKTKMYTSTVNIKYKEDRLSVSKVNAKVFHGNKEIKSVIISESEKDMSGVISTSNASNVMWNYTEALTLKISLDDEDEEIINLQRK